MQTTHKLLNTTHHALSAQDEAAVAAMRAHSAPFKGAVFGPAGRAPYDAILGRVPAPEGVQYEAAVVGGVQGVWCCPSQLRVGVSVLFLHGGGYVMGSAQAYRHFAGHFAQRLQAAVFVADYRLGPEHPFPAALQDAHAAYLGLLHAGATQIVVVGDSAGGGLSLSLLSFLQTDAANTQHQPAAAVVMSPWTDLSLSDESIARKADEELYLSPAMLQACASMYLDKTPASHPQASVVNAPLHGLPPLQIHVGTAEILFSDSLRYAQRAQAHNADVSLHTWQGMPHVFPNGTGSLQAADAALEIMVSFIAGHLQHA
jgi:monoterpene epsilon-lactone hydrolase